MRDTHTRDTADQIREAGLINRAHYLEHLAAV